MVLMSVETMLSSWLVKFNKVLGEVIKTNPDVY